MESIGEPQPPPERGGGCAEGADGGVSEEFTID